MADDKVEEQKPDAESAEGVAATGVEPGHMTVYVSEDDPATNAPKQDKGSAPQATRLPPASGRALKRLLDDDIEGEMEAALAAFDTGKMMEGPEAPKAQKPAKRPTAEKAEEDSDKRSVRVLSVRGDDVFVDLGLKSEGVVSILQFEKSPPQPGDIVELILDHYDSQNDLYILRRPGTVQEADWGSVAKGMIVDAQVKKVNKGGLEVTVNGIRGFMPAGQVDLAHIADQSVFVGQTLRSEVTEVNLSSRNLIVSRKAILERERAEKARATLQELAVGQIKDGVVRKIMDFGAFVDIGGVDGLIHVSQMSWQKVHHPRDVLSEGQSVRVAIVSFDPESKKIGLSLRQLSDSPWVKAAETYRPGTIVTGKVSKLMISAFAELEPAIEGLIQAFPNSPGKGFTASVKWSNPTRKSPSRCLSSTLTESGFPSP
ncbi:MAG: S1 RNA-binding domain-containing protein [Planctomycetota bacterium]